MVFNKDSQAQGSVRVALSLTADHPLCRMDDSPMSSTPAPETKLRDGYKATSGQPAFATCERSNITRNLRGARQPGFHFDISSYFEHGCSVAAPGRLTAPLVQPRAAPGRLTAPAGAATEGRRPTCALCGFCFPVCPSGKPGCDSIL